VHLVVAIEPSVAIVEQLIVMQEDLADPLRQLGADVDWTPAEHVRLVLRISATAERGDRARAREVLRSLAKNTVAPTISVHGAFFAPSPEVPRMVTVRAHCPDLDGLQHRIDGGLEAAGFGADDRTWQSWILVGRLNASREQPRLSGVLDRWSNTSFGTFTARELVVSTTRLDGATLRTAIDDRIAFGTGR
jgi:2'-5' RNA ligase